MQPINFSGNTAFNRYSGRMPINPPLPAKPNPLATVQKPQAVKATASGVQAAMNKISTYRGIADVPSGAGPQQMAAALAMLNQAKALANPSDSLEEAGLSRPSFDRTLDRLVKQPDSEKYDFKALKHDFKLDAALNGILAGTASGGLSYLGGAPTLESIRNALFGGGIGAGAGYLRAKKRNKDLFATAKILNQYGLNRPDYLRQALPLLKESNDRPTAAESKLSKYKTDATHHAQGDAAFASLDNYMKKAGLNSFQSQFLSRLITSGLSNGQIDSVIKKAGLRFGSDVAQELQEGFSKLAAFQMPSLGKALGYDQGLGLWQGAKNVVNNFKTVAKDPEEFKKTMGNMVMDRPEVKDIMNQAKNTMNTVQNTAQSYGDIPGLLKQYAPMLGMFALGAGGGGMLGGRGGAAMGGLGLPLMYYLMSQMNKGQNPFGFLSNMFGNQPPAAQPQAAPIQWPQGPEAFKPKPAFNMARQPLPVSGT